MERYQLSSHKLLSDYSANWKLKILGVFWLLIIVVFGVTRLPYIQSLMVEFSDGVSMDWVTSAVNFIIKYLVVLFVPLLLITILTTHNKQSFDEMRLYEDGIGFYNKKTDEELFAEYTEVKLTYGKLRESIWIESKAAYIKPTEYDWQEFSQSDILRKNLERYGWWR
ncbi:MAG: hypothetical protein LBN43_00750 [Oscillospiraceae bacterium]|nr:hypothetical protein [Oscillospiraceae bacterium]